MNFGAEKDIFAAQGMQINEGFFGQGWLYRGRDACFDKVHAGRRKGFSRALPHEQGQVFRAPAIPPAF